MLHAIRRAFPYTLPVMFGYAFLGLAYGLLSVEAGLPHWMAPLSSFLVYAGSMQFVLIGLLGTSLSAISLALLSISINGRLCFTVCRFGTVQPFGPLKPYMIHTFR